MATQEAGGRQWLPNNDMATLNLFVDIKESITSLRSDFDNFHKWSDARDTESEAEMANVSRKMDVMRDELLAALQEEKARAADNYRKLDAKIGAITSRMDEIEKAQLRVWKDVVLKMWWLIVPMLLPSLPGILSIIMGPPA